MLLFYLIAIFLLVFCHNKDICFVIFQPVPPPRLPVTETGPVIPTGTLTLTPVLCFQ